MKDKIYAAWDAGHNNVLLVMPTGLGKCLGKGTPVLMYNGSVKMIEDVRVGERVMGPDSKPRLVKSVCSGRSNLYKITPVKGNSWVCNDVHTLTLRHTETKETIDIPLNEYLQHNSTFKNSYKQFRAGVDFKEQRTTHDPYLVGLYLAEGAYRSTTITNPDEEIIQYLISWAQQNNMKILNREGDGCRELSFSDYKQGWGKNKIRNLAKSCTNREDRWMPKEYLVNSREKRLELLAGLLDGDGHLIDKCFEIITKYDTLSEDILYLARSLGFAAYSSRKVGTIKSYGFYGVYHRIVISGETSLIPTKIKRKQAGKRKQKKNVLNTGFTVESIGEGEYFGFTLDGDGRFLLGDFTVTHNTVTFCSIVIDVAVKSINKEPTAICVHRKELVQQISLTLAGAGVMHNIIAPRPTITGIIAAHRKVLNKQYYDYMSPITVVSVDTLNARINKHEKWVKSIRRWVIDEAAHVLKDNKWGEALANFTNARGLGVTATPQRLDKRGLGSHADGVFDVMVEGPQSRWGIQNGHLSKYKIAIPLSDYQDHLRKAGNGSDFSKEAMTAATSESHIVGDVVQNYIKFAKDKQTILFATDIGNATKMEQKFKDAGITAKLLTGLSSDKERLDGMIDFREKRTKVLLNVDLFDEGLDVPGIECVIMARPTMSLSKFLQMVGRGLRPMKGKEHLILIDHVGNVTRHGLPDSDRKWTLDRIVKRRDTVNFIRICSNVECNSPFDRLLHACPWCGTIVFKSSPGDGGGRIGPRMVDGDLHLIDPETIRELEAATLLESPESVASRVSRAAGGPAGIKAMKNQIERIDTQKKLSEAVAIYAGRLRTRGFTDRQIHKKFFIEHNMTITQALAEPKADMLKTLERIGNDGCEN